MFATMSKSKKSRKAHAERSSTLPKGKDKPPAKDKPSAKDKPPAADESYTWYLTIEYYFRDKLDQLGARRLGSSAAQEARIAFALYLARFNLWPPPPDVWKRPLPELDESLFLPPESGKEKP